jgi:hypothetical protein
MAIKMYKPNGQVTDVKTYKPGDPDFDKIAEQITHVSKVQKISAAFTYLGAEASKSKMSRKRRGEDVNKLR